MISIIIPIYNGARFIKKCYCCLSNQSHTNWEAVFVNDGSTDETQEILKEIAQEDSRVKVIYKGNEGVAIAREFGLQHAEGEYVTFLDVDDTLISCALGRYIDSFANDEADIVISGINMISELGKQISRINYTHMSLSGEDVVDLMCDGTLRWQLWGKAFRKDLFQDVITPKGLRSAEDMAVCIQATLKAQKVVVLNDCLYNYIQVPTSVTHSMSKEISYDALKATEFVEKTVGDIINKKSLDCLYLLIISGALRAGIASNDKIFKSAVDKHCNLKSITRLSPLKAINIGLYKYFHINLARFL